jgi:hypothetical protein
VADSPFAPKDFACPFADSDLICTEFMCPTRPAPSSQEKKLFVMMGRELSTTKKSCARCCVFVAQQKKYLGILGNVRYVWRWLTNKEIRQPQPQENL